MLRMAIFAPLMGIGSVVRALNTSMDLAWTIVLALVCVLMVMLLAFVLVMPKFKILQKKLDRLNLVISERLSGLLVVRAFTAEKHEEKRFDQANTELRDLNIFVNRLMAFMMPAMTLVMSLSGVLIVWAGAKLIDSGSLLVGDMLAFMQYAMHVVMSFLFVTMIFIMLPRAAVSAGSNGMAGGIIIDFSERQAGC